MGMYIWPEKNTIGPVECEADMMLIVVLAVIRLTRRPKHRVLHAVH